MDKFSLIDVFTKLAQDKNVANLLSSTVNSLFNNASTTKNNQQPKENSKNAKIQKYSNDAILNLLKRHDEISKSIDKQTKNPPQKD